MTLAHFSSLPCRVPTGPSSPLHLRKSLLICNQFLSKNPAGRLATIRFKAGAIREDIVTSALTKRGETQRYIWGVVSESEAARINDAAGAWRHCFLAASDKLKELVRGARRQRLRATEAWKEKARLKFADLVR